MYLSLEVGVLLEGLKQREDAPPCKQGFLACQGGVGKHVGEGHASVPSDLRAFTLKALLEKED